MATKCLAAIHLCRVRVTRLNDDGTPAAGPNNVYVSDKPLTLGITPTYEAGKDSTLVGGCDCIIATYRGFDKLKRLEFELDLGALEWGLFEMLTGAAAILDGSDVIGNWFNDNAFNCSQAAQPNVAVEGWQTAWEDDGQSPDFNYVHWLFPSTFWSVSGMTLENDFNQPKMTGFSRGNPAWGEGIYGDQPEAAGALGGGWYTNTIPAASCGYQTHSIT
jgi:hypothetical protein